MKQIDFFYKMLLDNGLMRSNIYYNEEFQFNFIFNYDDGKSSFKIKHKIHEDGKSFINAIMYNNRSLNFIVLPCSIYLYQNQKLIKNIINLLIIDLNNNVIEYVEPLGERYGTKVILKYLHMFINNAMNIVFCNLPLINNDDDITLYNNKLLDYARYRKKAIDYLKFKNFDSYQYIEMIKTAKIKILNC